jgi:hypothetical protein
MISFVVWVIAKEKRKKLSNYKGEGDWRVDLEERLVGKLNKCSLFQAEREVGRKEKKEFTHHRGRMEGKNQSEMFIHSKRGRLVSKKHCHPIKRKRFKKK